MNTPSATRIDLLLMGLLLDRPMHGYELYQQVHRDLIEADFYRRREIVREAILLLNDRRPAWSELVRSLDERPEALRVEASARSWVG